MLIDGLYVPLTAPFYRDGGLYLKKLEHNVDRYSLTPAAGLVAMGPLGEAGSLSDAETLEFLRVVSATAAKEKVLIAGVRRESVSCALAVAEAAAAKNFDAVLLAAPVTCTTFAKPAKELRTWFNAIADRSPLPVMLWSDAQAPLLQLSNELLAEVAQHPNVLGMLDADLTSQRLAEIVSVTANVRRDVTVTQVFAAVTGRMLRAERTGAATFVAADSLASGSAAIAVAPPVAALRTRTKSVGFQIMSSGNSEMLPLLQTKVASVAPALAACCPQACHEVYAAFKDGDPALAAQKEDRIREAARLMMEQLGVAGIKYGCDLNGYYGGAPRLPLLPLDAEQRACVDAALRDLKN